MRFPFLIVETTEPLAADASLDSSVLHKAPFCTYGFDTLRFFASANVAGEVRIWFAQTPAGLDAPFPRWAAYSITADTPRVEIIRVAGRLGRIVYVNGTTAQARFQYNVYLVD